MGVAFGIPIPQLTPRTSGSFCPSFTMLPEDILYMLPLGLGSPSLCFDWLCFPSWSLTTEKRSLLDGGEDSTYLWV